MKRHQKELWQWSKEVSNRLPNLSKPQAMVLALYSFGMVITQSCGLSSIAFCLSLLLGQKEESVRQRMREWGYDAKDKRGEKRQELDVSTSFAGLLKWVLSGWQEGEKRLALVLDASTLGQRFTVLAVSVAYRGCAIPVAWVILPATAKGAWKPHWLALLDKLAEAVPADWLVIVLTDRGLYAKWLFKAIQKRKWHPFMRINGGGNYRPQGQEHFRPLATLAPCVGTSWKGIVDCFSTPDARLRKCTLLARWDEGYEEAWLIVTDLPPETADAAWYALRSWIEQNFKDCKRGGFHWEQTKMTDPARANRLWLAIAVATLWTLSVGGLFDATLPPSSLILPPDLPLTLPSAHQPPRFRRLSCFRRGLIAIRVFLLTGAPLPLGRFLPFSWPLHPPDTVPFFPLPEVPPCPCTQ